jgi:hypothetical protein
MASAAHRSAKSYALRCIRGTHKRRNNPVLRRWIASPSSGARSRDPLARNEGIISAPAEAMHLKSRVGN